MGLEETLQRVEQDVRAGDLGLARDRLHSLLGAYPDNLDVRQRLGSVYWSLHYPAAAGKYWFLFSPESEEMRTAAAAFERQHGGNPRAMLADLKYHGGLEAVRGQYAEQALRELARRGGLSERGLENAVAPRNKRKYGREPYTAQHGFVFDWGCLIFAVLSVLFLIGVISGVIVVVRWLP